MNVLYNIHNTIIINIYMYVLEWSLGITEEKYINIFNFSPPHFVEESNLC